MLKFKNTYFEKCLLLCLLLFQVASTKTNSILTNEWLSQVFSTQFSLTASSRSSRPEVICEKGVLRNFAKFTGKQQCHSLFFNEVADWSLQLFIKKVTLTQLFSSEFCKIFKSTFSYKTFPVAAFVNKIFQNPKQLFFCFWHLIKTFLLKIVLKALSWTWSMRLFRRRLWNIQTNGQ